MIQCLESVDLIPLFSHVTTPCPNQRNIFLVHPSLCLYPCVQSILQFVMKLNSYVPQLIYAVAL